MKNFSLKIIAPGRVIYSGTCESLVIPAPDGLYGIMADHAPVSAVVKPGKIKIVSGGETEYIETGGGILHFENNAGLMIEK